MKWLKLLIGAIVIGIADTLISLIIFPFGWKFGFDRVYKWHENIISKIANKFK